MYPLSDGKTLEEKKGYDLSMNDVHLRKRFQTPMLKGILFLAIGVLIFFVVYIPQAAILSIMHTDLLTALYFIFEHGVLDTCFIIAAFSFTSAMLMRRASPADLGLVQFPFINDQLTSWWRRPVPRLLLLAISLTLVIIGVFVLLLTEDQWAILLHSAFNLAAPVNDLGLPALLQYKPVAFGVEVFVLCLLAPFAEEVLFR